MRGLNGPTESSACGGGGRIKAQIDADTRVERVRDRDKAMGRAAAVDCAAKKRKWVKEEAPRTPRIGSGLTYKISTDRRAILRRNDAATAVVVGSVGFVFVEWAERQRDGRRMLRWVVQRNMSDLFFVRTDVVYSLMRAPLHAQCTQGPVGSIAHLKTSEAHFIAATWCFRHGSRPIRS